MTNSRNQNKMSANDIMKLGGSAIAASIVLFFGWKTYKKISENVGTNKENKDERKILNKNNLQISEAEAQTYADIIYTALNTNTWDDTEAVINVLKNLQNYDDWLLLSIKFGKRKRNTWFSSVDGGIEAWLIDSLKPYEMMMVRKILSKINVKM